MSYEHPQFINRFRLLSFAHQALVCLGPTASLRRVWRVNCESEMARLDNFAVALQNEPTARGVIIFYAGKMADDRLPKRGEAEARVERIKSYLTKRRGIPADQGCRDERWIR